MRAFRLSISLAVLLPFLLWPACVSRSLPENRFRDSQKIPLLQAGNMPVVANPSRYSFSVVGDLHIRGTDTRWLEKMLAATAGDGDAFTVLLGDLADHGEAGEVNSYHAAIDASPMAGKVFFVVGNHDIFGEGWELYKAKAGPSHYSFAVGDVRFIALDTADASLGQNQTSWLMEELAKTNEPHTFLLSHYPPIVPGIRSYLKFADTEEAQHLMKVATENKVSGWLAAHYHSYILETIDSVFYLVAGGGGGRRMHPVYENFYVKVTIDGAAVSFDRKRIDN